MCSLFINNLHTSKPTAPSLRMQSAAYMQQFDVPQTLPEARFPISPPGREVERRLDSGPAGRVWPPQLDELNLLKIGVRSTHRACLKVTDYKVTHAITPPVFGKWLVRAIQPLGSRAPHSGVLLYVRGGQFWGGLFGRLAILWIRGVLNLFAIPAERRQNPDGGRRSATNGEARLRTPAPLHSFPRTGCDKPRPG
jgi:hypothetical protein